MEKVIISKLNSKDISQAAKLIQSLHMTVLQKRKDIFLPKEENWEEYLQSKLEDKNFVLLVAHIDNNVVGICSSEIKHCGDGKSTCTRDILFIEYIAVDERYRRTKIGTKLLDEVKSFAKEKSILAVELNVWGFNTGAIEFYEKNEMKPKRIIYEYLIDKEN